ncbi:hypothetical protein [Stakelama saccharophila]|uniref:Uncharacterized protein n=1 Tax=Stakelama saccharophila TaxID=3075605 RepID=A0ABZ0B721_9SPHN|nr:hypothetical protein [Stakelama sp. W311]WNO52421.1 hypothetical protein RPR59_07980 [Stakelama sp. W311]
MRAIGDRFADSQASRRNQNIIVTVQANKGYRLIVHWSRPLSALIRCR